MKEKNQTALESFIRSYYEWQPVGVKTFRERLKSAINEIISMGEAKQ